ncbi:hypothetical protein LCGC14_0757090 [marine sediment metagenome]|uniref:Uncharacterized protein n=1 Tax=marine sediment metagenome TaxID=412755 RepID=A0A0F9Q6C6_9ZZZZ|nr:MAG: hypothetical protein Lokiarch_17680 [Candidatus Lokiarchaeum sp. GC14_75]
MIDSFLLIYLFTLILILSGFEFLSSILFWSFINFTLLYLVFHFEIVIIIIPKILNRINKSSGVLIYHLIRGKLWEEFQSRFTFYVVKINEILKEVPIIFGYFTKIKLYLFLNSLGGFFIFH